jgi:small subunit ribosomal protein S20
MPNTKSAERRMRNSARKQLQNTRVKSRLRSLQKNFLGLASSNKKNDATAAYRDLTSALDKAVKRGVLHKGTVDRKKSRLALRLNATSAKSAISFRFVVFTNPGSWAIFSTNELRIFRVGTVVLTRRLEPSFSRFKKGDT